jgi:hypothetical protein
MNERLIHDVAWAFSHAMLDTVGHLLREEEQREFFAAAYNGARGAIEQYCVQVDRQNRRITPSQN